MENLRDIWLHFFQEERDNRDWWERKKALCKERNVKMARISGEGHIHQKLRYSNQTFCQYIIHLSFLMRQKDHFYMEEQVIPYQFQLRNGTILNHKAMERRDVENTMTLPLDAERNISEQRFTYDRLAAVQYAERWWNSYNPAYQNFAVDCTNYVSQCLAAGGAPMRGAPVREEGWWYQGDNWSFSWSVAHSMRWYLSGSTQGLKGKEVQAANELSPGDVICYDFQGNGRWDHNTFVVAKDAAGMPLVNAHTDNSRNRYWSYEDSTAWTPDIKYKFFQIGE